MIIKGSLLNTTGHHTCINKGGDRSILENAPFYAKKNKKGVSPFLGEGYYYWDNNIDQAHHWGLTHYANKYAIIESELSLTSETIFDLVGNRSHQLLFIELANEFSDYNNGKKWEIGRLIDFLRIISKEKDFENIFPFLGVRAIDFSRSSEKQFEFFFVNGSKYHTNLKPCFVICLFELSNVILHTKTLIFKN